MSYLVDATIKDRVRRKKAFQVLSAIGVKLTNKLRKALFRFTEQKWEGLDRIEPKDPSIRFEQQLKDKSARQLMTLRRRFMGELISARIRASIHRDEIIRGVPPDPNEGFEFLESLEFLESRTRLLIIEMRKRGMVKGE